MAIPCWSDELEADVRGSSSENTGWLVGWYGGWCMRAVGEQVVDLLSRCTVGSQR